MPSRVKEQVMVPKQFLTVALGGDANPRVFGGTLFHLGLRLTLVSQGDTP